jgi:hypothetical protein
MRRSAKEQRLETLENDFKQRLVACLRQCSQGRWGLFGQNVSPESTKALYWTEAEDLKETAREINAIRAEFGQPNLLSEKFLKYCSLRGSNVQGEPKLAAQFLAEIGEK